jgi:Tfp pilus assembly protein PilW
VFNVTTKPIDIEKLTQRKVTVPLIMVVGLVVLGFKADNLTVDYLDDFFIKKAEAAEQFEQIATKVEKNADLIEAHIDEYKLNENARQISSVEDQIYEVEYHEQVEGESDITRDRKRQLRAQLARLQRVRACIIRNQHTGEDEAPENCEALQ